MDRVAIPGDLDLDRRHFDRIFEQLDKAIGRKRCRDRWPEKLTDHPSLNAAVNPASWGYRMTELLTLEAIDPTDAFQLHILGSDKGAVPVPALLNRTVIHLHPGTSYEEYYEVLENMVSRPSSSVRAVSHEDLP